MRRRVATLLALVLIALPVALVASSHAAGAAPRGTVVLAQEGVDQSDESQGGEAGNEEDGEGQSDPDAETGASEDEDAPAVEEEGPVWTYQMSKILIGLLVLMAIGVGLAYYKLVVQRQRAGV
jgi:hypothetical protein